MKLKQRFQDFLETVCVNINGEIVPAEHAKISIFDRGFLFGDSIYEVAYSEKSQLIFFPEHLDRLYNSAKLLNLDVFLEKDYIISQTLKTLKAAKIPEAYVRIVITRGESEFSLDPNLAFRNNLLIIVKPKPIYSENLYMKGLHLIISDVLRNDRRSTNPNAKSGNYLNNVMAIREAKLKNADDAIMINHEGYVAEGTSFNIWCVKDNILYTPPEKSGLLKGITRDKVIKLARENEKELKIQNFNKDFLLDADEVFITSSTKGLMPVYRIDDKVFTDNAGSYQLMQQLSAEYQTLIGKEFERREFCYE